MKKKERGVYGTPSWAYTDSVPDQHSIYPGGQHTLAFYTKCVMPEGQFVVEAWPLESTRLL